MEPFAYHTWLICLSFNSAEGTPKQTCFILKISCFAEVTLTETSPAVCLTQSKVSWDLVPALEFAGWPEHACDYRHQRWITSDVQKAIKENIKYHAVPKVEPKGRAKVPWPSSSATSACHYNNYLHLWQNIAIGFAKIQQPPPAVSASSFLVGEFSSLLCPLSFYFMFFYLYLFLL